MQETKYGLIVNLPVGFNEAVGKTVSALKEEGFGILTEIDVKQTLKQKLDVDFRKYTILGACNPLLAHQALLNEENIGLLLPCNVIVYELDEKSSRVAVVNPEKAMMIVENDQLKSIAGQAKEKLSAALSGLEQAGTGRKVGRR